MSGRYVDGVWVEDQPQTCLRRHDEWAPSWGSCGVDLPTGRCGVMCRLWRCQVPGCGDVVYDHPHQRAG